MSSLFIEFDAARNLDFLAATFPRLCENTSRPPAISIILWKMQELLHKFAIISMILKNYTLFPRTSYMNLIHMLLYNIHV